MRGRDGFDVEPRDGAGAEAPELEGCLVTASLADGPDKIGRDQGLQQPVRVGGGDPHGAGELGHTDRAIALGEEVERSQSLDEALVHNPLLRTARRIAKRFVRLA